MYKLILASTSSKKLNLLNSIGYKPDKIISADVDKTPYKKEIPREYVKRIATQKTSKIYKQFPESLVLSAETVASRGRLVLTKPKNEDDAYRIFTLLSGRRHSVFTGICIIKKKQMECWISEFLAQGK